MEIYGIVGEAEYSYVMKEIVCKKAMPRLRKFDGIGVPKMSDASDENNILGKIQDIHERNALEENIFEEAKKTLEHIIETVAVVEEIIEPVVVTQGIMTLIDDLETITKATENVPLAKIDGIFPMSK